MVWITNLTGYFWELSGELTNRILSAHTHCINRVYFWANIFKGCCEKIVQSGDAQGGKKKTKKQPIKQTNK